MPKVNEKKSKHESFTIKRSAIQPRSRKSGKPKPPPLTKEQRKEINKERAAKNDLIRAALEEWMDDTKKKAASLADTHKKLQRYFIDAMFQNGLRLVKLWAAPPRGHSTASN